jgi:hypothetical protein
MRPTANATNQLFSQNVYAHPEWLKFFAMMKEAGLGAVKINLAWQLLMKGLETEERLLRSGQANSDNNPEYKALAKLFGEELKIDPGTSLALWSGGFAVSQYARAKGHTSLEFTKAGRAIDQLEFHREWKLQAPLWNALSRAFVHQPSPNVHIYIRAWQPNSVLIRSEVPGLRELQALFGNTRLHWHALYTDAKDVTKEITRDGRLVDEFTFPQRDLCVAALCKYVIYLNEDPASRAAKEMKALLEDNHRKANKGNGSVVQ